jgi:hypothetical protein
MRQKKHEEKLNEILKTPSGPRRIYEIWYKAIINTSKNKCSRQHNKL